MSTIQDNPVRQRIFDVAQRIVSKKGFSAVGLNEVLQAAKVPKGSFYHYFPSKDAFGTALLEHYFEDYLQEMQRIFQQPEVCAHEALMNYWRYWIANQTTAADCGKCLAVKLGAEVADLSEPMRMALNQGTSRIIARLATALSRGVEDGSVSLHDAPGQVALRLYALWLGASVMAKFTRTSLPFDEALLETERVLNSTGNLYPTP